MLTFEGKPKFLEKYAVVGFEVAQTFGSIGRIVVELHPRETTVEPHLKAYAHVQDALGEEVKCKVDDWRFDGTVAGITYNSASAGFRLTLVDALAQLDDVIGSCVFADQTIKDIVSGVAPGGVKFEYVGGFDTIKVKLAIQYQETSLGFLRRLLSGYGGQIWCAEDKVYVGAGPTKESVSLKLGKDITDFTVRSELGPEEVELGSMPYTKNKSKTSTLELKGEDAGKIQKAAVDLRKNKAKGKRAFDIVHEDAGYDDTKHYANRFLRSRAAGRFVFVGRTLVPVSLGAKVTLKDIGAGAGEEKAIVRSVQCFGDYAGGDVIWQFEATNPDAILAVEEKRTSSLVTSTAVVVETNDDLNRVKVRFPWDQKQRPTPFLRIAAPSWGKDHVHFIPPRIDDTVLVAWGQDDMDPVVLGCVTGGDKVGKPKSDFVLQTVDGQTIVIGDSKILLENSEAKVTMEKKAIEIDSGGSKIKMDAQSMELKAKSVTIDGTTGINLKTAKLDVG